MLFEAKKCTGWNRDSFFFFSFFRTSFHRFWWKNNGEKREREEISDRLAKRLSEDEFLKVSRIDGSKIGGQSKNCLKRISGYSILFEGKN